MFGEETGAPTARLFGPVMEALVLAIPEIESRTDRPVTLVGGLAVLCRLGTAYRVTSDLDTAHRRRPGEQRQLELLIASGARAAGPSGVRIPTPRGEVQVDILEVADLELVEPPEDPTDRLHVMAHAWAVDTATPMSIEVFNADASPEPTIQRVRVASPGSLIAMKLQAIMNRPAAKEGTDLLDIVRLTLDSVTGPPARTELREAGARIRQDAALHARKWFVDQRVNTVQRINAVSPGDEIDMDTVGLVADLLLGELEQ